MNQFARPFITALFLCAFCAGGCASRQQQLNVESFDLVWTTVRDQHFDPNYNGVDWNAVRDELRPKIERTRTVEQARDVMETMLHRLGQTHFAIIPGSVYRDTSLAKPADGGGTSGVSLRLIGGRILVTRVEPNGGADRAGVKCGWELTAVRGKPIAPLLADIGQSIHSDSLRPGMQARLIEARLSGAIGSPIAATFLDGSGQSITIQIIPTAPTGDATTLGNVPTMYVRSEWRRLPPNISYFSLNTFFDPAGVMPKFRHCVEETDEADGLILDLRGNPGGIAPMGIGIANLLVSKPDQKLGDMVGRNGPTMKFVLSPQPTTYDGALAILVDECSMSTSEILAAGLRDLGRARLFGVKTAGAALPSTVTKLPNGDRFQFVVGNYLTVGGKPIEGVGVEPDEVVVPDRAALLAGKDPILDAAVKWIRSEKK